MSAPLDHLRSIRAAAVLGDPPAAADVAWCFARFVDYVTAAPAISIEEAFGLCVDRGGEPWWRSLARERRDTALRELANEVAPAARRGHRVAELQRRLRLYERRWSRVDQHRSVMPDDYRGRPDALLFTIFRENELAGGGPVPTGRTALGAILDPLSRSIAETITAAEIPPFERQKVMR
ncbi:hypothetical protein KQX62_12025 [Rhodopseudomonas palustris]|uniref:TIGR02444 family protein n=1 Tax=Rhodopseudomonas palustris TaxID=1076 RepID=A0AAX3DSB6_RHOPL|nr:hypothetical protein [Rhodopseudomonas palustris]UYO37486.1 hypothetical protein KQX62_12025 [Rhodopseudomonas palustris]